MSPEAARVVFRAVASDGGNSGGNSGRESNENSAPDFIRQQIRRVPPPLGFGVRMLAGFFSLAPGSRRLQKWRNSRVAPLRDFAALCAALARFAQYSTDEHERQP